MWAVGDKVVVMEPHDEWADLHGIITDIEPLMLSACVKLLTDPNTRWLFWDWLGADTDDERK
jgi:hypothetical protein